MGNRTKRGVLAGAATAGAVLGGVVVPALSAHAATISVTTLADTHVDGQLTLREAVANASSGDTVTFAPGVRGTISLTDCEAGAIGIDKDLTISGPGAAALTVAQTCKGAGIFDAAGEGGITVTIAGLTLTGGQGQVGAAVTGQDVDLTLSDDVISGNGAGQSGAGAGAVAVSTSAKAATGSLTLRRTAVRDNAGTGSLAAVTAVAETTVVDSTIEGNSGKGLGGGLLVAGAPLHVASSTIRGNTGLLGGGITAFGLPEVDIAGSTIEGNRAFEGGGLVVLLGSIGEEPPASPPVLTIAGSTITGNTASTGQAPSESSVDGLGAGALLVSSPGTGATATIVDSTVAGNTTAGAFAGVAYQGLTSVLVRQSTITGNTGAYGAGGITDLASLATASPTATSAASGPPPTALSLRGVALGGNTGSASFPTSQAGGAASAASSSSTVDVPATFQPAVAALQALVPRGAGPGTARAQGTAGAAAVPGPLDVLAGPVDATYTLTQGDPLLPGAGNLHADPLLGALGDNGGPTRTQLPAAGSPLIDAGDPAYAAPPSIDQRGLPRVGGARVDIGATEVQPQQAAITDLGPRLIDTTFQKGRRPYPKGYVDFLVDLQAAQGADRDVLIEVRTAKKTRRRAERFRVVGATHLDANGDGHSRISKRPRRYDVYQVVDAHTGEVLFRCQIISPLRQGTPLH